MHCLVLLLYSTPITCERCVWASIKRGRWSSCRSRAFRTLKIKCSLLNTEKMLVIKVNKMCGSKLSILTVSPGSSIFNVSSTWEIRSSEYIHCNKYLPIFEQGKMQNHKVEEKNIVLKSPTSSHSFLFLSQSCSFISCRGQSVVEDVFESYN